MATETASTLEARKDHLPRDQVPYVIATPSGRGLARTLTHHGIGKPQLRRA